MDYITVIIMLLVAAAAFVSGRWFWHKAVPDDDGVIDHVFIMSRDVNDAWRREALAKAAAKYGRPFKCADDLKHDLVHRQVPRSRDLQEIDAASKRELEGEKLKNQIDEQTNVTRFKNGRKA